METFIRASAGVLLSVIMGIALRHKGNEISVLLSIAVCVMLGTLAVSYLKPTIDFIRNMYTRVEIDSELFQVLLKVVGVGVISEITALICTDAGNSSVGKMMQILGTALILYLSLPMFSALLDFVESMLEKL